MKWITKHLKWIVWTVIAVATTFLAIIFKGFEVAPKGPGSKKTPSLPPLPDKVKKRVQKAEEEALVARVQAKAKEASSIQEIAEIKQIPDDVERRKRLAKMMREI